MVTIFRAMAMRMTFPGLPAACMRRRAAVVVPGGRHSDSAAMQSRRRTDGAPLADPPLAADLAAVARLRGKARERGDGAAVKPAGFGQACRGTGIGKRPVTA